MFAKLFAPKWRHRDPAVRRAALEALPVNNAESQAIFATVAKEDETAAIRSLAIRRLQDMDLLRQLASEGREAEDRACAEQHLSQLLCAEANQGPGLEARQALLTAMAAARWFERVLEGAAAVEMRRFALAHVERQSLLGDVALGDADADLRLAALARITQRSTLERVAKGARRRDKQVYARAREVLNAVEAAEQRPIELRQQADKLCLQMEALQKATRHNPNWEALEAAVALAVQQWNEAAAELPSVLGEESTALAKRFYQAQENVAQELAGWQQEQENARAAAAVMNQQQAAGIAVCEALESARDTILHTGAVDTTFVEDLLAKCGRDWQAAGEPPPALHSRYREAIAALRNVVADAALLREAMAQLDSVLADVQRLLASESLGDSDLARLEMAWVKVPKPSQLQLDVQITAQIEEGLANLRQRLADAHQRQQAQGEKFADMVGQLEEYLRHDTYKPAFELAQQAQQILDALPAAVRHTLLNKSLLRRWQQVQAQLQEMRDWRQWANAPVMERLCNDMERLAEQADRFAADDTFDFTDCATRVRAAREEWKQLTSARSGAPKSLWRRFDAACTRAYAPCEAHFGEEHQQREVHLTAKQAICEGLETYAERLAALPFDQVDWPALEKIIQTADAEWRAVGPVPRAALSACNKRFRKVMEHLRAQAHARYERNREDKEALIERAAGLLKSVQDARLAVTDAVEKIKAVQAEWKGIGRAHKDGELWRRFRAACDGVFTLRDAEKTAQQTALAADVAVYEALCAHVEEAIAKAGEEPGRTRQFVEQIQTQWRAAPRLPKREADKLERRFRAAMERFEHHLREERKNAQRQARQRLLDKAALCDQLEALVESVVTGATAADTIPAALNDLSQQWEAQGSISGATAKGIEHRYAEALAWLARLQTEPAAALAQEFTASREAAREQRLNLCLQMEILAGVESPPEFREARLRYQVEHLAQHMTSGEQRDTAARAAELEVAWYATAAWPSAQAKGMEQRFIGALQRL